MRQFVRVEEVVPTPNRDGASSPFLRTTLDKRKNIGDPRSSSIQMKGRHRAGRIRAGGRYTLGLME